MSRTLYARSSEVSIAYQVHGDGPVDLVFSPGFVSHIEWCWEEPTMARFLGRLASFSRLIIFDKRGTGLSDPIATAPTLETRADDIRAVLDAAGSDRAGLLGWSEGSAMAVMFAALHPERTESIVLYGSYARLLADDEYPGLDPVSLDGMIDAMEEAWGAPDSLRLWSEGAGNDDRLSEWWGTYQRLGASPAMARILLRWYPQIDIREILPSVHIPALVLHRENDRIIGLEMGRRLAALLPSASFVSVPGDEHLFFLGDQDPILDEIEVFITGEQAGRFSDRFLTSVLFTDIVESTGLAAALGDNKWGRQLQSFYDGASRQVSRFAGREVKTTGDGLLATFDGPARAVQAALAIREVARGLSLQVRTGIHTGEVERSGDDIRGIAVHIASRILALAEPGEVLTSSTVRDLTAGAGIRFESRGREILRGVPGEWWICRVVA